jgi:hypothetical protein
MTPANSILTSVAASAALIATAAMAQPAKGGSRTLTTTLSGAAEVPGPGDTDGTGTASVTVDVPNKKICYELTVSGIEAATMAHIHVGPVGVAGAVVVPLEAPTDGSSEACIENVDANLVAKILARPSQYYVNVHNELFPSGAVRGQLG